MKIQQSISVGQAVFEVIRDGGEVVIVIDPRLTIEQIRASACLSLGESELADFQLILAIDPTLENVEKLGKRLATVALKSKLSVGG